jgi:hypothetical protein
MASTINASSTGSGGLISSGDASGVLQLQSNGTTALTATGANLSTTGSINALNTFGFENRIINGGMVIDQRGAGASVTPSNTATYYYLVDRFAWNPTQASKVTFGQNLNSVTPPDGFSNYLGAQVGVSANVVVGAGDYFFLNQPIEGFNFADFNYGTASAQPLTLSFWVRSSLTGTFGGTLENSALNRGYPFTYTISSANTWTQVSVNVVGDTTGTWVGATNGIGLYVRFSLGAGSTYSGTAGSWQAINTVSATGSVNVVATNSATWYVTGVQLEKGTQATSFDFRSIGQELALCQRYYEKSYNQDVVPGTANVLGIAAFGGFTTSTTTSFLGIAPVQYAVVKRATATVTAFDATGASGVATRFQLGVSSNNGQNWTVDASGTKGFNSYSSGTSASTGFYFQWTASAEL